MAQLVGVLSHVHQKVMGLIPDQGSYLDCGFNPWLLLSHIDVSLSLHFSLKINKNVSLGED